MLSVNYKSCIYLLIAIRNAFEEYVNIQINMASFSNYWMKIGENSLK